MSEPPRRVPTMFVFIFVLSKNIKNIKIFMVEFSIFTAEKKSLYIAWASFRNVEKSPYNGQFVNYPMYKGAPIYVWSSFILFDYWGSFLIFVWKYATYFGLSCLHSI